MKKLKIWMLCTVVTAFTSCKSPSVLINNELKTNAETYLVKGKMGLQIKQKMSFGPYATGIIKRGWISSYNIPFIIRFSGAKEKLSFEIADSTNKAKVHCMGKISQSELQIIRDWFGIVLKQEDAFAGNVSFEENNHWDFIIYNASNTQVVKPVYGHVQKGDEKIFIHGIRHFEGKNTWISEFGVYGYEFVKNNKVIGTVETFIQQRQGNHLK